MYAFVRKYINIHVYVCACVNVKRIVCFSKLCMYFKCVCKFLFVCLYVKSGTAEASVYLSMRPVDPFIGACVTTPMF